MLIKLPDSSVQKMRFVNTDQIRTFYANGTVGQSNWVVVLDIGDTLADETLASGMTQADAEAFSRDMAVALGIDWE